MKTISILFFVSLLSQYAIGNVTNIQLKSPFIVAGCSQEQIGNEGMRTDALTIKDTNDFISIKVVNSLLLCEIENNQAKWVKVDPFKGFNSTFFNYQLNQLSEKTEVIKSSNLGDRIDLVVMDDQAKMAEVTKMDSDQNGSFQASINLPKEQLFTIEERNLLDQNKEVSKVLVISANSKFTTLIEGREFDQSIGDVSWAGRNLFVTFKKYNNELRITSAKF